MIVSSPLLLLLSVSFCAGIFNKSPSSFAHASSDYHSSGKSLQSQPSNLPALIPSPFFDSPMISSNACCYTFNTSLSSVKIKKSSSYSWLIDVSVFGSAISSLTVYFNSFVTLPDNSHPFSVQSLMPGCTANIFTPLASPSLTTLTQNSIDVQCGNAGIVNVNLQVQMGRVDANSAPPALTMVMAGSISCASTCPIIDGNATPPPTAIPPASASLPSLPPPAFPIWAIVLLVVLGVVLFAVSLWASRRSWAKRNPKKATPISRTNSEKKQRHESNFFSPSLGRNVKMIVPDFFKNSHDVSALFSRGSKRQSDLPISVKSDPIVPADPWFPEAAKRSTLNDSLFMESRMHLYSWSSSPIESSQILGDFALVEPQHTHQMAENNLSDTLSRSVLAEKLDVFLNSTYGDSKNVSCAYPRFSVADSGASSSGYIVDQSIAYNSKDISTSNLSSFNPSSDQDASSSRFDVNAACLKIDALLLELAEEK